MKIKASDELKKRLTGAAANGSVIAKDVLAELKRESEQSETVRGNYNFFSTKRKWAVCDSYKKVQIVFTTCSKDLNHDYFPDKGNPSAPWFQENRTDIEPSTFLGLFKNLPEYDPDEIKFFCSAISLGSKVSVKTCSGMNDFMEAYEEANYTLIADSDQSTLHHSCMRHEGIARNAADFYHNFAGAKIMVAKDDHGNVVGRAVVWENLTWEKNDGKRILVSLIDRIYSSHSFVTEMLKREAQKTGITLRKQYNDFSHTEECVVMNPVSGYRIGDNVTAKLSFEVPVCRWHKRGVPYLDTFLYISLKDGKLELRNHHTPDIIAECRHSDGFAERKAKVCPLCNFVHSEAHETVFCPKCQELVFTETLFGTVMNGPVIRFKNVSYPRILFRKGRPIPEFRRFLQIEKLYYS